MLNKTQIRCNLKSMAKRMLKGSWKPAVAVLLIPAFVKLSFTLLLYATATLLGLAPIFLSWDNFFSASSAQIYTYTRLSSLTWLMQTLLTVPIGFGVAAWFLSLTDGEREPLSAVFCWLDSLRRLGKSLLMALLLWLRILGWMLLFLLPLCMGFAALMFHLAQRGIWLLPPSGGLLFYELPGTGQAVTPGMLLHVSPQAFFMLLGFVFLALVLGILFCLMMMRYLPISYLLNRYPEQPCGVLIRQGVHMMKGHLWEGLWLQLSFMGWLLAAGFACWLLSLPFHFQSGVLSSIFTILILPIPFLFVSAYRSVTNLLFCQYVEEASRLRDGQAHYTACPDESPFPSGQNETMRDTSDDTPLPWNFDSPDNP